MPEKSERTLYNTLLVLTPKQMFVCRECPRGLTDANALHRILLENRRSFGFLVGVACKKMARRTSPHTWNALKESGQLQERHVLMAIDQDIYLHIAHHTFFIHLIDHSASRHLGMVCHFNKCPKHKFECRVPGCGANRFVQILPWFHLKPRRLNEFNSQILFQRPA